jgi:DNA-binding NtrC family response regulator
MQAVLERVRLVAPSQTTVLVRGETGTGKEGLARMVHDLSPRFNAPFVTVNLGALPESLIESELFGHEKGAFTGAARRRAGKFEQAEGGTIFLDEVGELPLPTQVKLNRALQEKEIRRVGDTAPVKVDVRVIAATHRDLKAEAAAGRFREDLYYRLNVFPIRLPPLRERLEDVPLLAAHFLEKHARAFRREVTELAPDALRALTSYAWPGNVRELENAVERAVAVAQGSAITAADLPPDLAAAPAGGLPADEALPTLPLRDVVEQARDRATREYLVALLRELRGNVTKAAARAGMERESLHRLLKKHGLRSDDYREG